MIYGIFIEWSIVDYGTVHRITHVEDLISLRQFQLKCLFIAHFIYRCGHFIVKVGERCSGLSRQDLFRVEAFLSKGARDLTWVLEKVLNLPPVYIPDSVESEGSVKSTQDICLWVMKLSHSVTGHLLDFRVQTFNRCWLFIILRNTSRHWVICCSHATRFLGW